MGERGKESQRLRGMKTSTLEAQRAAINAELLRRRLEANDLPYDQFETLHSQDDCKVVTVFKGWGPGSGFVDTDFLVEQRYRVYIKRCETHGGTSDTFYDLWGIKGAIDESRE